MSCRGSTLSSRRRCGPGEEMWGGLLATDSVGLTVGTAGLTVGLTVGLGVGEIVGHTVGPTVWLPAWG